MTRSCRFTSFCHSSSPSFFWPATAESCVVGVGLHSRHVTMIEAAVVAVLPVDGRPHPTKHPRKVVRQQPPSRFDSIFTGPDNELVLDLLQRIEGPTWEPEHLLQLSEPEAILVCLCAFDGLFGNGGLECWLRCDSGSYLGRTPGSFRAVGLVDAADALEVIRTVFATSSDYNDEASRMRLLKAETVRLAPLEARLWKAYAEVTRLAARYAREHKSSFEHLRTTRPWDSVRKRFRDA
jgi:hypothetical protein